MFSPVFGGDTVAECEADVLGAHAVRGGGERGEDLLVGDAGDGCVDGRRRFGRDGESGQGFAGDGEFGQFGLGQGQVLGQGGDLCA